MTAPSRRWPEPFFLLLVLAPILTLAGLAVTVAPDRRVALVYVGAAIGAFLLLRMAHTTQNSVQNLLTFTRLVAQNLMQRRRIDRLLDPPPILVKDHRQMSLSLCQT